MQRAIMCGESETGVTVMYMNEGLDTGDIVDVKAFPIEPDDDFETIHDRSALVGGELLSKVIRDIESGNMKRTPQNDAEATYAAKIEKEDCKVDFTKDAKTLDFTIRGVTPIPGAFCYHNGKMLKIVRAVPTCAKGEPGKVLELDASGDGAITVATADGGLKILKLKPEGKGVRSAGDYIRGRKISLGDILE